MGAGADYDTFPDRLPTVKLTDAEKLNLITTAHRILNDGSEVAWADVERALLSVFGPDRGGRYIEALRSKTPDERWSRQENVQFIAAMYPYVPGDTEDEKAGWLIDNARPCFTEERWTGEVFPYVLERVEEYRAAGGTLDKYPEKALRKWEDCRLASCWRDNAARRHMNMLSPHMPESVFESYLDWMVDDGCDHVHLILANMADGEFGGYCLYGGSWSWQIDADNRRLWKSRLAKIRARGLGIALWLITDDSQAFANALKTNPAKYVRDLHDAGIFEYASMVVLALEASESFSVSELEELESALRAAYPGPVGSHDVPNSRKYARLGDVYMLQTSTGLSPDRIKAAVKSAIADTGKPVCAFEISRDPDRALCEAALAAGAKWVGNWAGGPEGSSGGNDFPAGTKFLHTNVSGWPVTSKLSAGIGARTLTMDYDKARVWPGRRTTAGDGLNANPWVVVEEGGQWYAATFEWLRFGQTSKPLKTVAGDHVKASPLSGSWRPRPGQKFGVFVSGLARHVERNAKERTNVVWLTYPGGPAEPEPPAEPLEDPPSEPPAQSREFAWEPGDGYVDVTLPDTVRPWQFAIFAHHAREAASGMNIWVSGTAGDKYRIPMSGAVIKAAAKAKQREANNRQTGAVNVFVNTKDVEIPASGKKYAGWEIPDPEKTYRGEGTRVVTPDGPNAVD